MVFYALEVWNIFLSTTSTQKRAIAKTARKFSSFAQIVRLVFQIEEKVMPSNIFGDEIPTGMEKLIPR